MARYKADGTIDPGGFSLTPDQRIDGIEKTLDFSKEQVKELQSRIATLEAENERLREAYEWLPAELLHHIDTMYPDMWDGVPKTARTSIRNYLEQKLRQALKD